MNLKPTLNVLVPLPITDAMLTNSSAAENDYPEWSATKTYAVGELCIHKTTHKIYESAAANNLNHNPTAPESQAGLTVWWVEKGPTNRWAMFDNEVNTETQASQSLTVVLRPGVFNAVYLAGLDAESLTITVRDAPGGQIIYSENSTLEASQPGDYWEYFFDRFRPQRDFVADGIDQYANAELTVTLSRPTGTVSVGVLAVGDLKPLGATQYGAKAKPRSNSRIKDDRFGKISIKRRHSATDLSCSAWLKLSDANSVIQTLQETMDVPCAWIAMNLPEYTGLRAFGLGNGDVSFDHPQDCLLTLNVQGMI